MTAIFKREFLFEDSNKRQSKKEVKIFYKFDVNLVKKSEEDNQTVKIIIVMVIII